MLRIFIDTSAFIALLVENDKNHKRVVLAYKRYKAQNAFFYTNNFILAELYTRLMYDCGKSKSRLCVDFIRRLEKEGKIAVLEINDELFTRAEKVFIKFGEHELSMVDAIAVLCLKEFKLDEIFSLDSDFRKVGLSVSP